MCVRGGTYEINSLLTTESQLDIDPEWKWKVF